LPTPAKFAYCAWFYWAKIQLMADWQKYQISKWKVLQLYPVVLQDRGKILIG
jgi:hypothetical protein